MKMKNNMIEYDEMVEAEVKKEKKNKSILKWALGNRFIKKFGIVMMVIITGFSLWYGIENKIKYEEVKAERDQLLEELKGKDKDITPIVIKEKMVEISELATRAYEYTGEISEEDYRPLFNTDYQIKSTKNQVDIIYEGVIKVGYDVEKIESEIDHLSKTVFIKLPEAEIFDNYIKNDTLIIKEEDNPLNPISTEEVNEYLVEAKEGHLNDARKDGIFEEAEEYMKKLVEQYFVAYTRYTVVFI